jgi:hypothetical protein
MASASGPVGKPPHPASKTHAKTRQTPGASREINSGSRGRGVAGEVICLWPRAGLQVDRQKRSSAGLHFDPYLLACRAAAYPFWLAAAQALQSRIDDGCRGRRYLVNPGRFPILYRHLDDQPRPAPYSPAFRLRRYHACGLWWRHKLPDLRSPEFRKGHCGRSYEGRKTVPTAEAGGDQDGKRLLPDKVRDRLSVR